MKSPRSLVLVSITALVSLISAGHPLPKIQPPTESAKQFVHDPCIIKAGSSYYVFSTGPGIPIRRSTDLIHWQAAGQVFEGNGPEWIRQELPESRGIWAPDIQYFGGKFHLYYAVSRFGSNRSIIGAATNKTLDAASKDYRWVDEGKVTESVRQDNFNAIDPNVLPIDSKRLALTYGSFWSGIKLLYLDAKTGKPEPGAQPIALARRPAPDAIEAPFLIRRGRYYYLFVSFDFCCRGVNSTYNIRVGRAESAAGPYTDAAGKSLLEEGGTQLLATEGTRIGPGHCAVLKDGGHDYLVYHFYDGKHNGVPTLQISPMTWSKEGWPIVGSPLTADP